MNNFINNKIALDKDQLLELALKQIDNTGYQLQQFGITDKFNRHNLIAILMTEEKRVRGEIDRLQFKLDQQKVRVNKFRGKAVSVIDQAIEYAPAPVTNRLEQLKSAVA